jgi:1-deoxy-D-xylulose-5-phosphate synthase
MELSDTKLLDTINLPEGIKDLSYTELEILAKEVREFIIEVTSEKGGHIAPSLGVVELTIALLKQCNPLEDKIVWDVGHQAYAYKILTDRKDRFHTLRQFKGITGFIKPTESEYDAFGVGHTSTSISAALGIKMADEIKGTKRKVYAVIGDGAMTGGLAFEALNNLGHLDKNLIVILNDNEMSISPNVGAFSSYLSRMMTGEFYTKFRKDFQNTFENAPLGTPFLNMAKKFEEGLKGFFTPGILFEELGLKYIGPIDGHNFKRLEKALHNAEIQDGPVLIHVNTKKGKGFTPAEDNPARFHGVSAFDKTTGNATKFGTTKTFTQIAGDTIVEIAKNNPKIVAITAAMPDGTGLNKFSQEFPDRFFDVGIAEQHAVTFSAGLAINGCKPYFFVYSTFLQRAYDQIIHDVALQNLPVTLCIDRAGLVGADGPTHHGAFDLSYLRCVPNFTIMMPKDAFELEEMIKLAENINSPVAIRYPRGEAKSFDELKNTPVAIGEPEIISTEGEIAIISIGHLFDEAFNLYKKIMKTGKKVSLINLRFLKPLNTEKLLEILKDKKLVITLEENSLKGGASEEIQSLLINNKIFIEIKKYGIPDSFIEHGSQSELRDLIGLTADKIFDDININS